MTPLERSIVILTALAILTPAMFAASRDDAGKDNPFSVELSAGAEYDSNVAVLELDTSSGEGDVAALIDFGLGFDKQLTDWLRLKLGYDFSQSLHEEFDAFDLQIHRGSADLGFDFGRIEAGAAYQYADAALDEDDFLVLERTAPYLSRLWGKKLFTRLEYARSEKTFDGSPGRDATADAWSLDTFVFVSGVRRYLILGYQDVDEDAADDTFDYTGVKMKLRFSNRFGGDRGVKLKTGVRYETRDYDAPVAGGGPREDERLGFEAELEWSVGRKAFVRTRYELNDNRSNLATVDFDEHVVSLEIGARF